VITSVIVSDLSSFFVIGSYDIVIDSLAKLRMSAIKKFFEKKKIEYKFKKLGAGHSLSEAAQQRDAPPAAPQHSKQQDQASSDGAQRAAAAAIARASQPKRGSAALAAQKAKIRQELAEEEKHAATPVAPQAPSSTMLESVPMCRILYRCELFEDDSAFPKPEMESRIESFLMAQLQEDPIEAAALMIKTLNNNPEKIHTCVDTIKKIIQNIISHPGEEKYLKIRSNNKALRERVFDLRGAREFVVGAGFEPTSLTAEDGGAEEEFLIMKQERGGDPESLSILVETLENAERICPVLDSDPRLFYPTNKLNAFNVPDEFYAISKEELKRDAELRKEAVEKMGMLRTKAMRERDEQRELRKYRFTAVRTRFPNGIILQGTFSTRATFSSLVSFIRDSLAVDWLPFAIIAVSAGGRVSEEEQGEKTLAELGLVPSAVVNVTFEEELVTQCRQSSEGGHFYFVKDELLSKIERL